MAFLKAWLSASVLLISIEKTSLPARAVKGVSAPRDWAIPELKRKALYYNIKAGSPPLTKLDLKPITSLECNTMTFRERQ